MTDYNRLLNLALIDLLVILKDEMVRDRQIQQRFNEEFASGYDYESSHSDGICAWRTRDREDKLIKQEGRRRLEKWTEEQDGIFERFYGGDGERAKTARHAYAAVPASTGLPSIATPLVVGRVRAEQTMLKRRVVPAALSRGVEVGLATGRGKVQKIRKRRVGEARFGVTSSFDMDELRARGGLVGVKPVLGARPLLSARPVGEGRPGR
ncbi:hypothetical protein VE01_07192 [Pseudogymnoascus verrucosus]|uniref:Uncharacterized protein n=1 Tax=Pseudogymnoascus verrucosus TaxID=342668 RepID=A0A1B8GFB3_9PEZI|nr:uncharacterized protein VE01_07192 [Pseudogymnoascus verrucosus]OBT94493.1 hypothetical protein VE01_07192 [Pseudogymnoascus verrucosus]